MTGESRARFFINTYKDHVNFSGASLRQYIFLQIGVYSMQKYPLQALQYEIESIKVCFVYLQTDDDDDFCYKRVQTPGMSPPRAGAWTYCLFAPPSNRKKIYVHMRDRSNVGDI